MLSQPSGELVTASTQFFYVSGSTLASLPLIGLTGAIIHKIIGKIAKPPYYKRLLDYDQLIVASRKDPELQECTSVE